MQHQKEFVEFRTPQHPSMHTNNWGGASPLLARNLPKESLDIRYLRLNTIRTRDEIFPAPDDFMDFTTMPTVDNYVPPTPSRRSRFLPKMTWLHKEKTLGSKERKRPSWLPRLDHRKRWPQGW
ncbi:hypothetical protein IFM89_038320 [Coptis chinensis]|uniref:Uncharacterized protein n=1 Tax=Coptis chinensis TaxID=261450 RepID=A0A835I8J7_9MAGN|nr:hypothetical protein IFM89_038320 [Coptis chinensis]